jgi:hypothetical protein
MHNGYFTLAALAREWSVRLGGHVFTGAFSVNRGELTVGFARGDDEYSLRIGTLRPIQYAFGTEGVGRPRRNAASFFDRL